MSMGAVEMAEERLLQSVIGSRFHVLRSIFPVLLFEVTT